MDHMGMAFAVVEKSSPRRNVRADYCAVQPRYPLCQRWPHKAASEMTAERIKEFGPARIVQREPTFHGKGDGIAA
jgi:uroporphyrinogen-III synthase